MAGLAPVMTWEVFVCSPLRRSIVDADPEGHASGKPDPLFRMMR